MSVVHGSLRSKQVHGVAVAAFGIVLALMAAFGPAVFGTSVALAQQPGQSPQGRDCQTVRTCNFARTGTFRGCLSSYSCRSCRVVAVKCRLPNTSACQELRCSWGG